MCHAYLEVSALFHVHSAVFKQRNAASFILVLSLAMSSAEHNFSSALSTWKGALHIPSIISYSNLVDRK